MTILLEPLSFAQMTGEQPDETPYWLTNPEGKKTRHTRASTIAGVLDDPYVLHQRDLRFAAHGIGLRPDLALLAASHHPDEDKAEYKEILRQALTAAAADAKANTGTGLHRIFKDINRGDLPTKTYPAQWRAHLDAYRTTIANYPIRVLPDYVEQICIWDDYGLAGTWDGAIELTEDVTVTLDTGRTVHLAQGDKVIDDLKSGARRWLDLSAVKFAVQLTVYANHTATWTKDTTHPHGGIRGERLDVRRDVALLIVLPATPEDGQSPSCELHWVDLEKGFEGFLSSFEGHTLKKIKKTILTPWVDHQPTSIQHAAEQWARARISNLTGPALDDLKRLWPLRDPDTGHVIRYENPTPEQTTALLDALGRVEKQHQIPFVAPPATDRQPNQTKENTHE